VFPLMGRHQAMLVRGAALLALVVVGSIAYRAYGWAGLALAAACVCMWALLHMSRMLVVLRRTAQNPVGSVASAVMLQSRLQKGMSLLQVLALTRALGQVLGTGAQPPEVYQWLDAGGDTVRCTFEQGKLVHWELQRR
jgi:hypothetical protein